MAQLEKSPFKQLDQSLLLDTSANKSSLFKGSDKWAEIKFLGKSIKRRSYHSSVIYDSQYACTYSDCTSMEATILTLGYWRIFTKLV